MGDLVEVVRKLQLDPNAITALSGTEDATDEDRGRVIFPSFFCPDVEQWGRVIRGLHRRAAAFEIFFYRRSGGDEIQSFSRLWPRLEDDTLADIRTSFPEMGREAEDLSSRVETMLAWLAAHDEEQRVRPPTAPPALPVR